ncbi:MAG: Hsp70 family protein, partial [Bacteroidota bacterium]
MISCGIDFGTSNSSIAMARPQGIDLVAVEDRHVTIPSAIFYPRKGNPVFGRMAAQMFFDKNQGRYMRSLKRVLGTPLMKHGTSINGKAIKFEKIIASFIGNIRDCANSAAGQEIEHVVMGRPVHFIDNNPEGDDKAQEELTGIAREVGFKEVCFQFEPIAAAFAHEVNITGEKLAIVADLGGGTSDFTIIRLSKQFISKASRDQDILANTGVRVGGNDFDKALSLMLLMPELGYKTTFGEKHLEVPVKLYHDLAEWSKVNFLYTPKIMTQARQVLHQSHDKKRFARLVNILEKETGHALLASAEDAKINLT